MRTFHCFAMVCAAAIVGLGTALTPAQATELGLDFVGTPTAYPDNIWNLGYEFEATSPVTVYALGTFDNGSLSNLSTSYQAGLWDSSGILLSSTFIGSGATQIGDWAFASITPITLTAGDDYVVGSQGGNGNDAYTGEDNMTEAAGINYLEDRFTVNGGLNSPLVEPLSTEGYTSVGDAGWFGGNIALSPVSTSVPEPASLVLFGTALAGFGLLRRKRA